MPTRRGPTLLLAEFRGHKLSRVTVTIRYTCPMDSPRLSPVETEAARIVVRTETLQRTDDGHRERERDRDRSDDHELGEDHGQDRAEEPHRDCLPVAEGLLPPGDKGCSSTVVRACLVSRVG